MRQQAQSGQTSNKENQPQGHLSPPNPDMLLTRKQVQTRFGIKRRFLEVAAVRGDGPPFIKIGRSVRYRTGDLHSWIGKHRYTSTSQVLQ